MTDPTQRRVLLIAGSDSSGGAGIEADQRVLAIHKCYTTTAITALTAQNTTGVKQILPTPPNFVITAIEAVWDDVGVDVVKTGMLSSTSTISALARFLGQKRDRGEAFHFVLDPVIKSTSGHALLPTKAVSVLRYELLPLATIVTPNLPEALLLVSRTGGARSPPKTRLELIELAREVWNLAKRPWVLLKGGHFEEATSSNGGSVTSETIGDSNEYDVLAEESDSAIRGEVVDVLYNGVEFKLIEREYIDSRNTHGTGCSLASAVAANLAHGLEMTPAVEKACKYVEKGIKGAKDWDLGRGQGPINHWA